MKKETLEKAVRISISLEENAEALLEKLCEGYPDDVSRASWTMFVTRVAMGSGICFHLPPLDEV